MLQEILNTRLHVEKFQNSSRMKGDGKLCSKSDYFDPANHGDYSAGDNEIGRSRRRQDNSLMKCQGAGSASTTKMAGKSHPAVNANKRNSRGVDYHDQLGVFTAQIS